MYDLIILGFSVICATSALYMIHREIKKSECESHLKAQALVGIKVYLSSHEDDIAHEMEDYANLRAAFIYFFGRNPLK